MSKSLQAPTAAQLGESALLAQVLKSVPMHAVKEALVATQNNDLRERGLPKRNVAYFVIGLGLFPDLSYTDTFQTLEQGKEILLGQEPATTPVVSSLVKARVRLGYESMKAIFDRVVKPVAIEGQSRGTHFAGRLVVAIDGVVFNTPDTKENEEYFGRSKSQHGNGAYPQVRGVAFVECGTRVLFDFELSGQENRSEQALGKRLLLRAQKGHLILADRLYCDGDKWSALVSTGADGVFRVKSDVKLPVLERYSDDSYRSELIEGDRRKSDAVLHKVRVIEYRVGKDTKQPPIRLITTLPVDEASAKDIALLYSERWNWEQAAEEFKNVLRTRNGVLRSNSPEMVKQELVGIFLAHYAVRVCMHEAALSVAEDVDRLSFTHSLHVIRRSVGYADTFSP